MFKRRVGASHIELLLVLAMLSVAMYPLAYIFNLAMPPKAGDSDEYLAAMLAHHVMETIIAKRAKDSSYFPVMSSSRPVVSTLGSKEEICEYFANLSGYSGAVTESVDPRLFRFLNKFKCSIDTYYLDENMFKIIVYVTYLKEGAERKVFFERLLPQKAIEVENLEGESF